MFCEEINKLTKRIESSDTDSEIYKLDIWQDCLVIHRENKKKFYPFLTPTPPNQFPMDKRLKCKFQSAKAFRRECGRISFWPQDREGFLKQDAKSVTTGRQANKYIKIRNFCYWKDTTKGMKGKPQTRRRYLQHKEQTNDSCTDYLKKSQTPLRQHNRKVGTRHSILQKRKQNGK